MRRAHLFNIMLLVLTSRHLTCIDGTGNYVIIGKRLSRPHTSTWAHFTEQISPATCLQPIGSHQQRTQITTIDLGHIHG